MFSLQIKEHIISNLPEHLGDGQVTHTLSWLWEVITQEHINTHPRLWRDSCVSLFLWQSWPQWWSRALPGRGTLSRWPASRAVLKLKRSAGSKMGDLFGGHSSRPGERMLGATTAPSRERRRSGRPLLLWLFTVSVWRMLNIKYVNLKARLADPASQNSV